MAQCTGLALSVQNLGSSYKSRTNFGRNHQLPSCHIQKISLPLSVSFYDQAREERNKAEHTFVQAAVDTQIRFRRAASAQPHMSVIRLVQVSRVWIGSVVSRVLTATCGTHVLHVVPVPPKIPASPKRGISEVDQKWRKSLAYWVKSGRNLSEALRSRISNGCMVLVTNSLRHLFRTRLCAVPTEPAFVQ